MCRPRGILACHKHSRSNDVLVDGPCACLLYRMLNFLRFESPNVSCTRYLQEVPVAGQLMLLTLELVLLLNKDCFKWAKESEVECLVDVCRVRGVADHVDIVLMHCLQEAPRVMRDVPINNEQACTTRSKSGCLLVEVLSILLGYLPGNPTLL